MNPNGPNVVLWWGIAALDQEGAEELLVQRGLMARRQAPYNSRTLGRYTVVAGMMPPEARGSHRLRGSGSGAAKTSRIELRASEDDRDLLDRAAAALGVDRSSFLLSQARLAAQRVLADREHFLLDRAGQQEWERINSRPARSLQGLVRLLERPSPFVTPVADQPEA